MPEANPVIETTRPGPGLERRELDALLNTDLLGVARLRLRRFRWMNATFELMFGYEPGELVGLPARVLYPDSASATCMEREPRSMLQRDGSFRTQLRLQKKGGEGVWADLRATLLSPQESLWVLADITGLKEQATRLETLAFHDPLTGLPNRAMLQQLLERELATCKRFGGALAVCFMDLDGFKPVNDRMGHEAGDVVLQKIAERLQQGVRSHDIVGRIGGDEFVLVLTRLESREQIEVTVSRLLARLRAPILLERGAQAGVSASIGIALCPQDAQTGRALLRCADEAMYQAKAAGPGIWRFHEWSA